VGFGESFRWPPARDRFQGHPKTFQWALFMANHFVHEESEVLFDEARKTNLLARAGYRLSSMTVVAEERLGAKKRGPNLRGRIRRHGMGNCLFGTIYYPSASCQRISGAFWSRVGYQH